VFLVGVLSCSSETTPSGGAAPCQYDFAECCTAPDNKPCRGLAETDCLSHPYCDAIRGIRYAPGDQGDVPPSESFYLGCFSFCSGAPTEERCIYREDSPADCYRTISAGPAPDDGGWVITTCHPEDLERCDLGLGGAAGAGGAAP
jgi:hypothetical protein